jgi:hypothetical protein
MAHESRFWVRAIAPSDGACLFVGLGMDESVWDATVFCKQVLDFDRPAQGHGVEVAIRIATCTPGLWPDRQIAIVSPTARGLSHNDCR